MRSALDHRQVQGQHVRALQASDQHGRACLLLPRESLALLRRPGLRQGSQPGVRSARIRRRAQHFDVRSEAMYQGDLRSLRAQSENRRDYLEAHLWASTAVFHWSCFVALMKEHGETAAEDAAWKASRVTRS